MSVFQPNTGVILHVADEKIIGIFQHYGRRLCGNARQCGAAPLCRRATLFVRLIYRGEPEESAEEPHVTEQGDQFGRRIETGIEIFVAKKGVDG